MAVIRLVLVLLATAAGVNGSSFKGTDKMSHHGSCKSLEKSANDLHAAYENMYSDVPESCNKYIDDVAKYYTSDVVIYDPNGQSYGRENMISVQLGNCQDDRTNPEINIFLEEYEKSDKEFGCDGDLGYMNGQVPAVRNDEEVVHRFSYNWKKNEKGDWKVFWVNDSYSSPPA